MLLCRPITKLLPNFCQIIQFVNEKPTMWSIMRISVAYHTNVPVCCETDTKMSLSSLISVTFLNI